MDPARRNRRRRRRAVGGALLQQTDAGGHSRAFLRHRRFDRLAHHPARYPFSDRPRTGRRDRRAVGGIEAVRRIAGRNRRRQPPPAPAVTVAIGIPAIVRGRFHRTGLHRQRRRRLHIPDIECHAGAVPDHVFKLPAGTAIPRRLSAGTAGAAHGSTRPAKTRLP